MRAPLETVFDYLLNPLLDARWGDWSGFWLRQILDDRYTVTLFFPFLPLLLLCPPRYLRLGVVLTGAGFLALAFGVPYLAFWFANCAFFYWFAERYAGWVESAQCRRTGATAGAPEALAAADPRREADALRHLRLAHLTAIGVIVGWYLLTLAIRAVAIPAEWNLYLYANARWLFPFHLGAKPAGLDASGLPELLSTPEGHLLNLVFWNAHNIGTAYLVWRMTHYLSEINRGTLPRGLRTFPNFLAWLCYAPNLIQGPIERFARFQEQMDVCHAQRRASDFPVGLARIGWGIAKSLIATLYFDPLLQQELGIGFGQDKRYFDQPWRIESYPVLYLGVFFIIFRLYLEFSGYCDVSAGMARLLGYRQIENFNHPWFATSLRDFWRRWHISLSLLLRDYIYIGLGGNRRHATLNLVATFALCGVWHIPNGNMLMWGVLMGLMLAINQWWVARMEQLDARIEAARSAGASLPGLAARTRAAVLRLHPLGPILAWAFTMHCFVFSLLIFFGGRGAARVSWELIRRPLAALTGLEIFAAPGG